MAYRLELPSALGKVHDIFHISQLKCYVAASSHVLDPEPLELDESLTYEEQHVQILDRKVRSIGESMLQWFMSYGQIIGHKRQLGNRSFHAREVSAPFLSD